MKIENDSNKLFGKEQEESNQIISQSRVYRFKKTNYFLEVKRTDRKPEKYLFFTLIFNINNEETILGYFMIPESNLSDIFVIKQSKGWQFLRKNIPEKELSTEELEETLRDYIIFDLQNRPILELKFKPKTKKEIEKLILEEKKDLERPRFTTPIGFHPDIYTYYIVPLSAPNLNLLITKENVLSIEFGSEGSSTLPALNEFVVEEPITKKMLNKMVRGDLNSLSEQIHKKNEKSEWKTDLKKVQEKVYNIECMYVWFRNKTDYLVCSCWVIGTFLHQMFDKFPYLNILGVTGSGKTRLMQLLVSLSWNGELIIDPSSASVYREAEKTKQTQAFDENVIKNAWMRKDDSLLAVAKAGFQKGLYVPRQKKIENEFVTEKFEVYSPKIWGGTEELRGALLTRSIEIIMEKIPNKNLVSKFDPNLDSKDCMEVRRLLMLSAFIYDKEIKEVFDNLECPEWMEGREFDVWAPIQAICQVFYPDRYEELKQYIRAYIEEHKITDYTEVIEKGILQVLENSIWLEYWRAKEFIDPITEILERKEPPNWLNSQKIVSAIRKLKITKKIEKHHTGNRYYFNKERTEERAKQFGVSKEETESKDTQIFNFSKCEKCGEYKEDVITHIHDNEQIEICESCYRILMKGGEYQNNQEGNEE